MISQNPLSLWIHAPSQKLSPNEHIQLYVILNQGSVDQRKEVSVT